MSRPRHWRCLISRRSQDDRFLRTATSITSVPGDKGREGTRREAGSGLGITKEPQPENAASACARGHRGVLGLLKRPCARRRHGVRPQGSHVVHPRRSAWESLNEGVHVPPHKRVITVGTPASALGWTRGARCSPGRRLPGGSNVFSVQSRHLQQECSSRVPNPPPPHSSGGGAAPAPTDSTTGSRVEQIHAPSGAEQFLVDAERSLDTKQKAVRSQERCHLPVTAGARTPPVSALAVVSGVAVPAMPPGRSTLRCMTLATAVVAAPTCVRSPRRPGALFQGLDFQHRS